MPGIDSVSQGVPFETQITKLNAEIDALNTGLTIAQGDISLDEILATQKPADFSNSQFVMDQTMMMR